MDSSTAKVLSLAVFILLGYVLRRRNILKDETFHAISGLVMFLTLPCVVVKGLNGIHIGSDMAAVAALGLVANVVLLLFALTVTRILPGFSDRGFSRLNMSGFSIGPFAIPYVQAFYPTTGLLTAIVFDIGNSVMSAGGTYAILSASGGGKQVSLAATLRNIFNKLRKSGPIVAFAFMFVLCLLDLQLPDAVITCASVGAAANTFLCMIMIGESVNISMSSGALFKILKILGLRLAAQCALAAFFYFCTPFDLEVRRALTLMAFSPTPAMNLIFTAQMGGSLAMAANLSSLSVATAIIAMSVMIGLF